MNNLILFLILSRPLFLFGVMLLYALGVSIANYLGYSINWTIYILGQSWVTLLQLSAQYLNEYFNYPADMENPNRTALTGGSGVLGPGKLPRRVALTAALTCLAILASLTVVLMTNVPLSFFTILIMLAALLVAVFYSTPPVKLEGTGYGELVVSIMVAFLVPLYAYLLQTAEIHRLVPMATFPLVTLHMAMLLAFELPDYATDIKFGKNTFMVRLGWEKGMLVHNILILSSYLLLVIAAIFGFPNAVWIPAVLTIPLGLLQIWQMRRISIGEKPNWNSLTITAISLFGLMTYLMTFTFWTN